QAGVGGYTTVRGFDERTLNFDESAVLQNELRPPPIPLGSIGGKSSQLQLLGFVDVGGGNNKQEVSGETSQTLSSAGVGLRLEIGKNFSLRADYGFQLSDKVNLG